MTAPLTSPLRLYQSIGKCDGEVMNDHILHYMNIRIGYLIINFMMPIDAYEKLRSLLK